MSMRRILVLLPLLAACHSEDISFDCTSDQHAAIWARPVDDATGDSIGAGARLIIRDGAYADTAASPYLGSLVAGPERPGTYDIIVSAPDHFDWTKTGVVVTADQCHVHEVKLVARLLHY